MPARLGPWSLRAALPSVAAAETPSSSPAAAASAAASSLLEIASERAQYPSARHSINGLPVKQIQAVNQHLSNQSTSITSPRVRLVLSEIMAAGRFPLATRAIDRSLLPAFRKSASISCAFTSEPDRHGIVRLNNAAESGKDLRFFHFLMRRKPGESNPKHSIRGPKSRVFLSWIETNCIKRCVPLIPGLLPASEIRERMA
jgi:hypothetical protein